MKGRIKQRQLGNGQSICYLSQANLDILTREVFDDNLYGKHGITLQDGDCVLDVGANIGLFMLYLNHLLDDAKVFAFEPIPETFDLLKRNVVLNNHLDLKLFNCGLAAKPGTAQFAHFPRTNVASTMCPDESPGFRRDSRRFVLEGMKNRGGILKLAVSCTPNFIWWPVTESIRRFYQKTTQVTCQLRTLSDIIDEHEIWQIGLLKVDVEGAESQVLEGLREEHWSRVRQAVVEVHHGGDFLTQIEDSLTRRGFLTTTERLAPNLEHLHVIYAVR